MQMRTYAAGLALALTGLSAGGLSAQACLGLPSSDGQIAVAGSFGEDGTELGGDFHVDVSGPGSIGFSVAGADDGFDRRSYSARGAYELYLLEPSICVVGGLLFMDDPGAAVDERLGVPLGFGFGKTLDADRFSATIYALPQYVWVREVRQVTELDEEVDTSNQFMGEAGVTFGFAPFYVGGAFQVSTIEGDDPGFRLRAGLLF